MAKKEYTAEEIEAIVKESKTLAEENAKLQEALNSSNEENVKLKKSIEDLNTMIKDLNKQLANKESENEKLSKYPVLTHKGKSYELVDAKSTVRFKGRNIKATAEVLKEDKDLLEYCIKKGFGCLKEKGGK